MDIKTRLTFITTSIISLLTILYIVITLIGQQVPPGHKGKILGVDGYKQEILEPGRSVVWGRDQLVLLDFTTNVSTKNLKVTMKDYSKPVYDKEGNIVEASKARPGLEMDFILSYRYRLRDDNEVINTMFNDVKVDPKLGVTAEQVLKFILVQSLKPHSKIF